jgi:hypothetical protein
VNGKCYKGDVLDIGEGDVLDIGEVVYSANKNVISAYHNQHHKLKFFVYSITNHFAEREKRHNIH